MNFNFKVNKIFADKTKFEHLNKKEISLNFKL